MDCYYCLPSIPANSIPTDIKSLRSIDGCGPIISICMHIITIIIINIFAKIYICSKPYIK